MHKEDDIAGKLRDTFKNSKLTKPVSLISLATDFPGLLTDRSAFIKLVRLENKRFRPLGKFITEFVRQIEDKPSGGIFSGWEVNKRPKREAQMRNAAERRVSKTFKVYRVNAEQVTFTHLNNHLQAILKFYIESASYIPLDP